MLVFSNNSAQQEQENEEVELLYVNGIYCLKYENMNMNTACVVLLLLTPVYQQMRLNRAAPPLPHTTTLSPLILTLNRHPYPPATSLSAVCVSSLISNPVRNIDTIICCNIRQIYYDVLFFLLFFHSEQNMLMGDNKSTILSTSLAPFTLTSFNRLSHLKLIMTIITKMTIIIV